MHWRKWQRGLYLALALVAATGLALACVDTDSSSSDSPTDAENPGDPNDPATNDCIDSDCVAAGEIAVGVLSEATVTMVAEAPLLQPEVQPQTVGAGEIAIATLQTPDRAVGGCMAWAVRKEAKLAVSDLQLAHCGLKEAAKRGALSKAGELLKFVVGGVQAPARIGESAGEFAAEVCVPRGEEPLQTSLNIRISRDANRTLAQALAVTGGGNPRFHRFVEVNESAAATTYSYITHTINETDAATCAGPAGDSLTATDDTCFLRLEGQFVNRLDANGVEESLLTGTFAEKNNAGVRTLSSVRTLFKAGVGASYYSFGLPSLAADQADFTSGEGWTPADFRLATPPAEQLAAVNAEALPGRSTVVPEPTTGWDCAVPADAQILDLDALAAAAGCQAEALLAPDITSCTGGDEELEEAISSYLCDSGDPLTSSEGISCP